MSMIRPLVSTKLMDRAKPTMRAPTSIPPAPLMNSSVIWLREYREIRPVTRPMMRKIAGIWAMLSPPLRAP